MTRFYINFVVTMLIGLVLSGCDKNVGTADLQVFTEEAFKNHVPQVDPLPPLRPSAVFIYTASDQVDPFDTENLRLQTEASEEVGKGANGPDLTRRREPLEAYPIDALSLVGVMNQDGIDWAIINTPDNTVHRVTSGNYIGTNFGEIVTVEGNKVNFIELIRNPVGKWAKNAANLILVE